MNESYIEIYFWTICVALAVALLMIVLLWYRNIYLKKQLKKTTKELIERNKAFENITEMFQRAMNEERQRNSKSKF